MLFNFNNNFKNCEEPALPKSKNSTIVVLRQIHSGSPRESFRPMKHNFGKFQLAEPPDSTEI